MKNRIAVMLLLLFSAVSLAPAQQAEVTIQLNEQFFEALLDAVFKNSNPPEFPLSVKEEGEKGRGGEEEKRRKGEEEKDVFVKAGFDGRAAGAACPDSIKLQREVDGVRTAVRFRDGQILTPIAFAGNYNPPLVGCVEFAGVAETNIELEFDAARQALVGRARVNSVNLSGTGGIGGTLLARLVQNSLDKKINPLQILQMDRVSFVVPIQNSGNLRMKATGIRHEIANGVLNVRITYEFQKAD